MNYLGGLAKLPQNVTFAHVESGLFSVDTVTQRLAIPGAMAECLAGMDDEPETLARAAEVLGPHNFAYAITGGIGSVNVSSAYYLPFFDEPVRRTEHKELRSDAAIRILESAAKTDHEGLKCLAKIAGELLPSTIREQSAGEAGEDMARQAEAAANRVRLSMPGDTQCTTLRPSIDI